MSATPANTIIFPAKDLDATRKVFTTLLGVEPFIDSPYYVGFKVGDQQVGLDPHSHTEGARAYWGVDDVEAAFEELLDAGAEPVERPKDVGQGKMVASVRDANGNLIGITS